MPRSRPDAAWEARQRRSGPASTRPFADTFPKVSGLCGRDRRNLYGANETSPFLQTISVSSNAIGLVFFWRQDPF